MVGRLACFLFVLLLLPLDACSAIYGDFNTFPVSVLTYPKTTVRPFDLRYIRVDLPPWFSSLSVSLESDVDIGDGSIGNIPESQLPMICFRDGSPPLPYASNSSVKGLVFHSLLNESIDSVRASSNVEQCHLLQKNLTMRFSNEEISPGAWYFGLFNGIGVTTTQSKMIIRGPSYSFSLNVSIEGCRTSAFWGQSCNQTVDSLLCTLDRSNINQSAQNATSDQTVQSVLSCKSPSLTSCLTGDQRKVYFVDIEGMAEQLSITANISLSSAHSNSSGSNSNSDLWCFARQGAMPSASLYDYAGIVDKSPLLIQSPKVGRWFITFVLSNLSEPLGTQLSNVTVCFSIEVNVSECPMGSAGPECASQRYMLQTNPRMSVPFESYYLPVSRNLSSQSANFVLEPLLSNFSSAGKNETWTYFVLDIPRGAAGGNLHVRLTSDTDVPYELYARLDGLPSLSGWDYYFANKTSNSNGSLFFKLYESSMSKVDFYLLYAKEGTWGLGLRNVKGSVAKGQNTMSLSLERCAGKCSFHGSCKSTMDGGGLTTYSFCSCDRNHGGFDCSVEIVSPGGHVLRSIFLIGSNAAAILPAYWALRQKAFAEWVLFTSSGIASGIYHACDVGTWCLLPYGILQFMDFWLSFMAVVSTFVYLTTIDEKHKRAIHTAVAILTALMAKTNATRSANIILVVAIGTLGLLVGWLLELSTKYHSVSSSIALCLNVIDRWQAIKQWLHNLIKAIIKRFRWDFVAVGFIVLSMAGVSWHLETSESYWIWHSVWHVTIYTSSFLFLCSKATVVDAENQREPEGDYQLTRQDSFSRVE
ncbi:hypothetical protein MLD38_036372 [Melastoma candidum]|uniref:Uncharacterized protein n=1 Tax=Melastoma candidum TaxID=119954 RepID=A0ACB9LLC0_9MYRT|nr:hypothetical protein MLD38_036372 [Melastoma candidum]